MDNVEVSSIYSTLGLTENNADKQSTKKTNDRESSIVMVEWGKGREKSRTGQ